MKFAPTPELAAAIETFVQGWTFTRSFTHPAIGEQFGPLWVARDAPRKHAVDYRKEEWIACGIEPKKVHDLVQRRHRGTFAICAMLPDGADEEALRAGYKTQGYRLGSTEALMVHDLARIPRRTSPTVITRILTPTLADELNRTAGRRHILPEHLKAAAPLRAYVARMDERIVGWVRSINCNRGTWCADMHVEPKYRRQGIASALLARMLRDDRKYNASRAVLLASHAGAKLYTTIGYRRIGTLFLFTPQRT